MTITQALDMHSVMEALAQSRPVFYSESDFKHALSWQIQQEHPSVRIRQEVGNLIEGPDRRYVDIWLPDSGTAIELKYLTRTAVISQDNEEFRLRDQSAQDLGRYGRAFSFLGQVGMDPYQGEGFRDVGGVATQGSGDVGVASPAHQGAGQVAKSCHHLGSVAGPYLGAVLVKGDVPYPMHPVLDVPMLPENPQQPLCLSSSRSHTGHRITHRCLCPSFHRPLPLYPAISVPR